MRLNDPLQAISYEMTEELRNAVDRVRRQYGGQGIGRAWRRLYHAGWRINEIALRQILATSSNHRIPTMARGDSAMLYRLAGVTEEGPTGQTIINPEKWRSFVHKAIETPTPLERGDEMTPELEAWRDEMESHSVVGRRKQSNKRVRYVEGQAQVLTEESIAAWRMAMDQRCAQSQRQTRTIMLPSEKEDAHWLPFASAPSTCYWYWRWGITKDQLRVFIRTHAQWSVDYKHGFVDINDMAAVRWLYATPLADKFQELAQSGDEARFRYGMIKVMARLVSAPEPDFMAYEAAMRFVKRKVEDMRARELPMEVTVKQLHAWYQASEMD